MTYTPEASAEAHALVTRYGVRLIHDARDPAYADPTRPGAALQEMHDAAAPVLAFIATLEDRIAQFERWGVAGARAAKPMRECPPEPDEDERASEPQETRPEPLDVEPRELHDVDSGHAFRR